MHPPLRLVQTHDESMSIDIKKKEASAAMAKASFFKISSCRYGATGVTMGSFSGAVTLTPWLITLL